MSRWIMWDRREKHDVKYHKKIKEEYGYDPLLEIYPYPKFIWLKCFLGGIHHCVTVVDKWIFDSNFPFELPLAEGKFEYCCLNDNKTRLINGYKVVLK